MFVLHALIQFLYHKNHQIELVFVVVQMNENIPVQQKIADFLVAVPWRTLVEIVPKVVAQVVFALHLIVYLFLTLMHIAHHLLYVRDVVLIVVESLYQAFVDVLVGVIGQRFQY